MAQHEIESLISDTWFKNRPAVLDALRKAGVRLTNYVEQGWVVEFDKAVHPMCGEPKRAIADEDEYEVLAITTAYEQGFGHAHRIDVCNPYPPDTKPRNAWERGREVSRQKLDHSLTRVTELLNKVKVQFEAANELCRSSHSVAARVSLEYSTVELGTNFGGLHDQLVKSLPQQLEALNALRAFLNEPKALIGTKPSEANGELR